VKRLIALSLGVQRAQLEQRIGLVCPRPCLLRPLFLFKCQSLFTNCLVKGWNDLLLRVMVAARVMRKVLTVEAADLKVNQTKVMGLLLGPILSPYPKKKEFLFQLALW